MVRFNRLLLVPAVVLAASATCLSAQTTTTGAVNGVITDQSGAVVAGASVRIRDLATGAVTTAKSSGSGSYRFDLLQPGAIMRSRWISLDSRSLSRRSR